MKFMDFFSKCDRVVTIIEEILNGKRAVKWLECGFWEKPKRKFPKFLLQQYSSLHKERRPLFCFECVNSPLLIMSTIKCLEGL